MSLGVGPDLVADAETTAEEAATQTVGHTGTEVTGVEGDTPGVVAAGLEAGDDIPIEAAAEII